MSNDIWQMWVKISGSVFAEVFGTLRPVGFVVGYFFCSLNEIWVKKSCEVGCILLQNPIFLLFDDFDSKEVD